MGLRSASVLAGMLLSVSQGGAYDYTADLLRDCARVVFKFNEECEAVTVEPLTKAEALSCGLQYRAVGWGKLFPADEDGWYQPKSGEFIPQSWALTSPDHSFHRCT